jgi:hypothetical protein
MIHLVELDKMARQLMQRPPRRAVVGAQGYNQPCEIIFFVHIETMRQNRH